MLNDLLVHQVIQTISNEWIGENANTTGQNDPMTVSTIFLLYFSWFAPYSPLSIIIMLLYYETQNRYLQEQSLHLQVQRKEQFLYHL